MKKYAIPVMLKTSIGKDYWRGETARLIQAMADHGVKVKLLNKRDGYERWWETAAGKLIVAFYTVVAWLGGGGKNSRMMATRKFNNNYISVYKSRGECRVYWTADSDFDPGRMWDHAILSHEMVHAVDASRVGAFLFSVLYLFVAPCLFGFRRLFEQRGYDEDIRVLLHIGEERVAIRRIKYVRKQFTGSSYMWMDVLFGGGFRDVDKALRRIRTNRSPLERIGFERKPVR